MYPRLPRTDKRYTIMTIQSFRCKQTKKLFEGKSIAKFANFRSIAERKLQQLDSAITLNFLRSPAGNHLEALGGDRKGEHSIRINDQFRICFIWTELGPTEVEIVDYH
jgi:proteic killer suppression protein